MQIFDPQIMRKWFIERKKKIKYMDLWDKQTEIRSTFTKNLWVTQRNKCLASANVRHIQEPKMHFAQ